MPASQSFLKQQNLSDSLKRIAIVLVCVIQGSATHNVIKKNLLREGFFKIIPWSQKAFSPDAMKELKCIEPKLEDYRELILSCAEIFEDDLSRKIYSNVMTACILRKFDGLTFIDSEEQYFPLDIEMTKGYRSFMDCGAFCGDTLENLVKKNLTPKIYIAFEPDWRNFLKITQLIEKFNIDKALLFPCALSRNTMPLRFTLDQVHSGAGSSIDPNGEYLVQCVAIDECLKGIEPTFIKIDIEGNEIEALIGAKKTIVHYRPDIAVAIYHYADHYFKIPNLLHRWNLGYRFHIRTYDYFGNETILYATCPSH
ncbi:FkbM family methyltransferase [Allochromatium tepidum]|uniref:Methyltransferase FkbM domain-containing protein n=1 Tax=Allochromatium tepidum TaxID=553982 RepID=A0ABN6GDW3_9GAMM|nr:FkbM family methyltransferase [Allochromatium tepidum]BCU07299.1 hypothetical protein Atep_19760 [Allochromatium tepidum]